MKSPFADLVPVDDGPSLPIQQLHHFESPFLMEQPDVGTLYEQPAIPHTYPPVSFEQEYGRAAYPLLNISQFLPVEINTRRTASNKDNVRKSALPLTSIIQRLKVYVDWEGIKKQMQDFNTANPARQYHVAAGDEVDAVFTEAICQYQRANFLDPKEQDGIMGRSTAETMGLFNTPLSPGIKSSGLYGQGILNGKAIKAAIPLATNNEFTASNWYQFIVKPSWLGVKIADGIHILLLRKLKDAETWLLTLPQYKGLTPAALGAKLGFNAGTSYSGARLSAAKQTMHGFGLALDINVNGNPWIGAGWVKYDKELLKERTRMIAALRNASGDKNLPGNTVFAYLHYISQSSNGDTARAYDMLKQKNDEFVNYLKSNASELGYWKRSQSFGNRNPLNGFLNLHKDLVYALRHIAGLAWGAIDFGENASGDIMHFDLRTQGIGKIICKSIGGYVPKSGHPAITENESYEHVFYDQLNEDYRDDEALHEAIEEDLESFEDSEAFLEEQEEDDHVHESYEAYPVEDNLVADMEKAIRLNRYYADQLGWQQYVYEINDLLLPYSGLSNVSLGEEDFALALSSWQEKNGFSGKNADGILGKNTWDKMKALVSGAPVDRSPATAAGLPGTWGKLVVNTQFPALKKSYPEYIFTENDALWLARFVEGEAGGADNTENHAVVWAMFHRFGMLRQNAPSWTSFGKFITYYSTTLQPFVYNVNVAKRIWSNHTANPSKYPVISKDEYYAGTSIKKVQYVRHLEIQKKQWHEFTVTVRNMIVAILNGKIPNPGIGLASEFASTLILLKSNWKENNIKGEPSTDQWKAYTLKHAAAKKWIWIGETSNINQKKNAFFLDKRFLGLPANAVRVIAGNSTEPEWEEDFNSTGRPYETEADDELNAVYEQPEAEEDKAYFLNTEDLVKDLSKAIRLNKSYGESLGWNQFYDQINDLLLPYSGLSNVSLGEEEFVYALSAWQTQKGLSDKDADGILGPNTWRLMQPELNNSGQNPPGSGSAYDEWLASPVIQTKYPGWQHYKTKRDTVLTWGIANAAHYIENAINEWNNAGKTIRNHFDNNFDGTPNNSYLNLKRLYEARVNTNPAAYIAAQIVNLSFFNRQSPGHRNLKAALDKAEAALRAAGHNYNALKAWSFVPRTFNDNSNKLSNHALGKALDINPATNPHITSKYDIMVINAVCRSIIPSGLLAETNPDTIRRASDYFKLNFNQAWIDAQTQPALTNAIKNRRTKLNRYAANGFLDLPTALIRALQNEGLSWGGAWKTSKDYMHFEIS